MKTKVKVLLVGSKGYLGSALLSCLKEDTLISVTEYYSSNRLPSGIEMKELIFGHDVIIHVAGGGGSKYSIKNQRKALEDTVLFTDRLVNSAISTKIPKIIFTSTMYVYDNDQKNSDNCEFNEESKLFPRDYYSSLKLACEKIVERHPCYIILRLSHLYGYGSGNRVFKGGVLNNICNSAVKEGKLTITNLNSSFDLVSIDDVVDAIDKSIHTEHINQILNIGGGAGVTLKSIVEQVSSLLDVDVIDLNREYFRECTLDIHKAKKILNWSPSEKIKSEIRVLINAYN
jgi:nucleoside-diphosphate-sugar epimerase